MSVRPKTPTHPATNQSSFVPYALFSMVSRGAKTNIKRPISLRLSPANSNAFFQFTVQSFYRNLRVV